MRAASFCYLADCAGSLPDKTQLMVEARAAMTDEIYRIIIIQAEAAKRGVRTIWTVYEKPRDYPTGWIAKMHEADGAVVKPTGYVIKAVELEPIREKLARAGSSAFPARRTTSGKSSRAGYDDGGQPAMRVSR
jgi:hypothetical protein